MKEKDTSRDRASKEKELASSGYFLDLSCSSLLLRLWHTCHAYAHTQSRKADFPPPWSCRKPHRTTRNTDRAISVNKISHPCCPSSSQETTPSPTRILQLLPHVPKPRNHLINIRHEAVNPGTTEATGMHESSCCTTGGCILSMIRRKHRRIADLLWKTGVWRGAQHYQGRFFFRGWWNPQRSNRA